MVKGIRKTKKSNDRVVLQTTARTERIKKMENNATQNQIRLLQNIAGLAADACLLTKPLSSKTPLPIPPNNYRLPSWFKAVTVNHYSGKMHDNYFKRFRFVYLLEP